MKKYWLTAISALMGTMLVVFPILGALFGDTEGDEAPPAALFVLIIAAGVLMLAGLWWMREGRFTETVCLSLIGIGLVAFGFFFFWLLLIPTALALVVIWFGIVKRGLVTELRPAQGT
jgi:hypothetical protein